MNFKNYDDIILESIGKIVVGAGSAMAFMLMLVILS